MLVNSAPIPSMIDLLTPLLDRKGIKQGESDSIWCVSDSLAFYLSKSCFALSIIVDIWREITKKAKLILWVPEYFCDEALSQIDKSHTKIVFYKISNRLKTCKETIDQAAHSGVPDIVLLVHYFGFVNYDKSLCDYCAQNNVLIIEDAAHVLRPTSDIGRIGGFTFYSPHKTLPVMQGSILSFNRMQSIFLGYDRVKISDLINQRINQLSKNSHAPSPSRWIIKKIVQRLLPQFVTKFIPAKERVKQFDNKYTPLSRYSYNQMKRYTNNYLRAIEVKRRKNYVDLLNMINRKCSVQCNVDVCGDDIPFLLQLVFDDKNEEQLITSSIKKIGGFCSRWPLLPDDIKSDSMAWKLANEATVITIHENLPIKRLLTELDSIQKD